MFEQSTLSNQIPELGRTIRKIVDLFEPAQDALIQSGVYGSFLRDIPILIELSGKAWH